MYIDLIKNFAGDLFSRIRIIYQIDNIGDYEKNTKLVIAWFAISFFYVQYFCTDIYLYPAGFCSTSDTVLAQTFIFLE